MTCFLLFWCMYAGHVLDKPWYEKQCFIPVNLLSLKIVWYNGVCVIYAGLEVIFLVHLQSFASKIFFQ